MLKVSNPAFPESLVTCKSFSRGKELDSTFTRNPAVVINETSVFI